MADQDHYLTEEVATPDAALGSGEEGKKGRNFPSPLTILILVIIAVWILGLLLPSGEF